MKKKHGSQIPLFTDKTVRRDRFLQWEQQGQLDTLAQLPTEARQANQVPCTKNPVRDLDNLKKRARQKYFTNGLVMSLVDVIVDGAPTPLKKSYWNSYHCVAKLDQVGQTITGQFCNARWCMVCNRIRTAKLINGYMPEIAALKKKYFVTLTVPNCKHDALRKTIRDMIFECTKISRVIRERRHINFHGIRKLECTYNASRDDYHPHFHLIIDSEQAAQEFVAEWLYRFPAASFDAQDIRVADNSSVFELFKYFTKVVSKAAPGKHAKRMVHIRALDTIFRSMSGKRVFQPMGIRKVIEDVDATRSEIYAVTASNEVWTWLGSDWISKETGEILTNYAPTVDLTTLINERFVL